MVGPKELCPHCGRPMPKTKAGPHQLYVAELPTFGREHPTKIGVAKNAVKRAKSIGRIGSMPVSLKYVFSAPSEARAREVEYAVKKRFPRHGEHAGELFTEVLAVNFEAVATFIVQSAPDLTAIAFEAH